MIVITNTGGRPDAFALCATYMRRQTYAGRVTWVIAHDLDDVPEPADMPANWTVRMVRAPWTWAPGMNTQAALLSLALDEAVKARENEAEPIAIVEDDDWYAPGWLAAIHQAMRPGVDIFGERHALYYNVRTLTWRCMGNRQHASLCNTAIAWRGVDALQRELAVRLRPRAQRSLFIDLDLWRNPLLQRVLVDSRHVVGIKGMPGRGGIGSGHSARANGYAYDPMMAKLRELIGEDAEGYRRTAAMEAVA